MPLNSIDYFNGTIESRTQGNRFSNTHFPVSISAIKILCASFAFTSNRYPFKRKKCLFRKTPRVYSHQRKDDEITKSGGAKIVAINGEAVNPGDTVKVDNGVVTISAKGTPNFKPAKGLQMEPIWLPAPEAVLGRIIEISQEGYQNSILLEHLGWSLFRVIAGFIFCKLDGLPLYLQEHFRLLFLIVYRRRLRPVQVPDLRLHIPSSNRCLLSTRH